MPQVNFSFLPSWYGVFAWPDLQPCTIIQSLRWPVTTKVLGIFQRPLMLAGVLNVNLYRVYSIRFKWLSQSHDHSSDMLARRLSPLFPSHRTMALRKSSGHGNHLAQRIFPSTGFETIDPSERVEEERLPFYNYKDYFPVRIGQMLHGRYQVSAKLGYGTTSTVWLGHDLM